MKNLSMLFFLLVIAALLPAIDLTPESASPNTFMPYALRVSSAVAFPLGQNGDLFTTGGGAALSFDYNLPTYRAAFLRTSLAYEYAPSKIGETFSVLSAGLGGGVGLLVRPRFSLAASLSGGYYYSLLNDADDRQGYGLPYLAAETEASFLVNPRFSLGTGLEYKWLVGFEGVLRPYAAAAIHLGKPSTRRLLPAGRLPMQPQVLQGEAVEFGQISLERVFPVFFSYYNTHPVGSVVIRNVAPAPIADVKVGLFVSTYMDAPKETEPIAELKSGQSATIDLHALFNDNVLSITEGKEVVAALTVEYKLKGVAQQQRLNSALRILYRNAMTWDDDRRAAVFVTAKDPVVLSFSKNVNSIVQGVGSALDANLRMGIALHEALGLHKLTYAPDPKSPFSEKKKATEDFLQFPRETLEYRSGDCDDLSILYCALLESVGVETAFITVPGHIYMAFALDTALEEARKAFSKPDDLVFWQGRAWVPLEVTEREGGFLAAWTSGAKQWRQSSARQQAGFFPVHEAWQVYPPVQLPGTGAAVLPAPEQIGRVYQGAVAKFVEIELAPRVAQLQAEIRTTQGSAKAINKLGVLYAKYQQWDKAEKEFRRILEREQYVPAILNMGNIWLYRGDNEEALDYFERAYRLQPENASAVLGMARLNHEIENYGQVAKLYGRLKELNPGLADQYSYLSLRGEEATRAAEVGGVRGAVIWEEQQ